MKRSTPIRRTPIKSKRSTPRRRVDRLTPCSVRRCDRRPDVRVTETERYCKRHATAKADEACRAWFHDHYRRCVACGADDIGVQWAHVHTRGMTYIRWDRDNAVGLCARCHYAYTKRPAAWVKFVERSWPGLYVRLLHRELWGDHLGGSVDVADVILTYRSGSTWAFPDPPEDWRESSTV